MSVYEEHKKAKRAPTPQEVANAICSRAANHKRAKEFMKQGGLHIDSFKSRVDRVRPSNLKWTKAR